MNKIKKIATHIKELTKKLIGLIIVFFPGLLKKYLYKTVFGYKIDPTAKIGFSYIACEHMLLEKNTRIGHFNIIKGLNEVLIKESAIISSLNWISAYPKTGKTFFKNYSSRQPNLELGCHSAITSRHRIDCTDEVIIGNYTTIAGFNTQLLTHSVDIVLSCQACKSIEIGNYCFIGTRCIILPGVKIADQIVLGAGSVATKSMRKTKSLYAGQPARFVKDIDDAAYFRRSSGEVL